MYDAIVIGARVAGSPTAMLLARKGYSVLAVDRATFPSDTLSTHILHAPGVAALKRWGLLDELVASGCPAIEQYAFDFGPVVITGTSRAVEGNRTAYCPRRTVLDEILVNAARAAGVEVREGYNVDEVVVEDGRVVGIRSGDREDRRPDRHRGRRRATVTSPRPSAPRSTTPSRGCSTPTTPTSATCPWTGWRPTSDPTAGSASRRRTTG